MKSLPHWIAVLAACACVATTQAQTVRPEVGKPLQQAADLLKAGKAKDALAKAREADAASGKTPAEQMMIDRMKGAAAQRAGDNATAIQAFESLFNSGKLSGAEQAQMAEQIAYAYSQQKDWPRTNQWVQKAQAAGSTSAQLKQLQAYAQSQSGDYSAVAKEAQAAIAAAEQAGRKPDEGDLLRLADAQQRTGQTQARGATLDKLLAYYPKKEYWSILLGQLPRKTGFSDRFSLDLFRLRLATGNLTKTEDYMEMAQLALQAGYPAEGKAVVEKGFASGALGTGAEGERHKRLRDLAIKRLIGALRRPIILSKQAPQPLHEPPAALDACFGPRQVALGRAVRQHEPAHRIGAKSIDDRIGIDHVLLRLRHLDNPADFDR